jgi:hypothetical protein
MRRSVLGVLTVGICALWSCEAIMAADQPHPQQGQWLSLFNGKDLNDWIPKINHHPLGDNYRDTFIVRDGVLRVSYDRYATFTDEFAHLIYRTPFSNYRLRMDYRFVGKDTPGGPPWASRNSGVMIHGQAPESIGLDQPFPVSVEVQLLNGSDGETRSTGNVCTPGTRVDFDGVPLKDHCRNSSSRTYMGDAWVHLEIEVRGGRHVSTVVDGRVVLEYQNVQLDPTDLRAMEIYLSSGLKTPLEGGYISLQGEGHPIEFRNIQILVLSDPR